MPIYNVDGETYNISDNEVKDFEKDFPDATVRYSADGDDYDIPIKERDSFLKDFPDAKYSEPQQKSKASNTVNAQNGMIFTAAGLDSLDKGATPVYVEAERDYSKPIDLSRPQEPQLSESLLHPFKQGAEEARQIADSPQLNKYWANRQQEASRRAMQAKPTASDYEYRQMGWQEAAEADAARKMKRGEFDQQNFDKFYQEHVAPVFGEERQAGEQRAQAEIRSILNEKLPGATPSNTFKMAVANEKYNDPEKIANATLKRVQNDDAFGDYVLSRMGINAQATDNGAGESEQLSEREKKYMQMLFARENAEVADQMIQRICDQYQAEDAPQSVLDYIAGKAFHENFVASLSNAMVRRAANSRGIREQLRAMASEEYGENASWLTRMAGGAAPFAVDIVSGGFMVPGIAGGLASNLAMKGGAKLLSKAVTRELSKRAAARGLEDAALREAAAGGAEIAERYLATQSPVLNTIVRSIGSAANFSTFEVQSELVNQLANGEFDAGSLAKQAVHGAMLGGVMGAAGGMISNATRRSGLAGKIAGDIAGFGTEAGIFAAANGIEKAINDGIDITDVDWADATGKALIAVAGMKVGGQLVHGAEAVTTKGVKQAATDWINRYRKSKDYGMQLNQRDLDELKQAGYNFDDIFKGLGEMGKVAPVAKTITRTVEGVDGKPTKKKEAYLDVDAYNDMMQNMDIASSTKRKIAYIATGKLLNLEPVFGVVMDVNPETGKATITTKNVFGRVIETKDYDSEEEAKKEFEIQDAARRINVVDGLENMAKMAKFDNIINDAKEQTLKETGVDVDDILTNKVEDKQQAALALDTYIRNLSDAYNDQYQRRIESAIMPPEQGGENGGTTEQMQRSERRQAAYEKGATVDESQLSSINYENKLAEARMLQLMPDDDQRAAYIRQQVADALDADDVPAAERILQQYSSDLTPEQVEAVESYIDSYETRRGIDDSIQQKIEDFEQRQQELLSHQSDADGNVTALRLKDGSIAYYKSGDMNGYHSSVIVDNGYGETKQISSNDIVKVEFSAPADQILADNVQKMSNIIADRYNMLSDGSMLLDGQEADIAMANQLFHITALGQDEQGNTVVQMEDGDRMTMTPEQLKEAIDAADYYKIQELLQGEKNAAMEQQRTQRFSEGIVGYSEGTPKLDAKDTKPEVAAEYLLSQTGADGETVSREQVLQQIRQEIEQRIDSKEKALQALQQAQNDMAMYDEGDEAYQRAEAIVSQLTPFIDEMTAQRRKWGEIRQAMMNDEERKAFEKERANIINKSKSQSKKDVDTSANAAEPVPTVKDILDKYPERRDAEAYIEEQRKQLSQKYKNDVYPKWDDMQKQLNDYQQGLSDLTYDQIKAITDTQTLLEAGMAQMVQAQNGWKKLSTDIGRAYTTREREQMTPHEVAMNKLAGETDKAKKLKLAKEAFKDDPVAFAMLDNMEPQDVYEYIAENLGKGTINWEGLKRGEHEVRGLISDMGKDKKRGVGAGFDTNGYNYFLAPTGQGKGIDEVIHDIAEGSPYNTEEVRDALLPMLSAAEKPTDISHRMIDNRIAQAQQIYEENLERERDAELQAEDDAIREMTGMDPEEYDAYISGLEQRLAEQEGYATSEEYFNQLAKEYDRTNEGPTGGSQETGTLVVQGKEGDKAAAEAEGQGGTGEAETGDTIAILNKMASTYNSLPLVPIEMDMDDRQLVELLDVPAEFMDGATDETIKQYAQAIRSYFEKGNVVAVHFKGTNKILVVASKLPVKRVQEGFFHENIHHILDMWYGNHAMTIAENFWNNAPDEGGLVTKDFIKRHYDESDQKEEFFVTWLGKAMVDGLVDEMDSYLTDDSDRQRLNNILKEIGYDRESETAARRESQEVQEVVAGQSPASADQGTDGDRLKSSIQGLEDYSEDEIKDIVLNYVQQQLEDADADVKLMDIAIIGSRTNGTANPDSDLDVLVEYKGKEREDGLFNLLNDDDDPLVINGIKVDINPITEGKSGTIAQFLKRNKDYKKEDDSYPARLAKAKEETDTNPTEAQKKAGNYKMGHISFGGYKMSIENPKGSTRSGVDANGNPWSIEMQDTYGYIGQKYGVDGDHLDFFINDDADLDNWNGRVYVVDQKNDDGTFDEHKVMYGYPTWSAARKAYERNYEPGWWSKHVMAMTGMKKDNFDKWLNDSDHKRKPFAEYARTKNSETVSNPVEQLEADIEERKNLKPEQADLFAEAGLQPSFKDGELEAMNSDQLRQLKKKKKQDLSTSRVILGTTNVRPGSLKERTLKKNIAQAETDIAAIDGVLTQKDAETKARIEQQEIGGAMVDQLENMGMDVTADVAEMRRVRKQAEKDQSEEGKLRHMRTSDGKIYGFTYKGKMYLDPRKIDAELPIHEYAHPWCEAFRRLNPEGWKDIVSLMKSDKDTWEFVKQVNPDLTDENDIAEEMIAKFSGKKGQERAQAEYERMNKREPNYKAKWGNIWKNISKAIQDFWKQVGDFLHIKYESVEQVYDQVVRDFANKVNPRKRVEQWLKDRDKEYLQAVKDGDDAKAKELFDAALRENIGNGITPFVSAGGYRGKMQKLAHGVKTRDAKVVAEVADLMAPIIPKDAVLVPAPSHTGKATDMLDLAQAISERTGAPVADVLTSDERGSQYDAKYAGKPLSAKELGIKVTGEPLPAGKLPVVIDNVVDTGNTAEACVQALGKGIVASLANSKGRYKRVTSLKSAEPVVTDKKGNVIPLSDRFEFMIEEGNLFSDQDFEEPTNVVPMSRINDYGYNENTPIGRMLTRFEEENGDDFTLAGYVDSKTGEYVFLGKIADSIEQLANIQPGKTGMQDGMNYVRLADKDFDIVSPKLVKEGYKLAIIPDYTEEPEPTKEKVNEETPTPVKDADSLIHEVVRREQVAKDKKEADDAVKKYLSRKPKSERERVRQLATKAVLKTMDYAGVPYKVVSKEEEKQMLQIFSMMNQEAIKDFARRLRYSSPNPHAKMAQYIVYNTNEPFAEPIYAEKLSVAKIEQEQLSRMAPEGSWELMYIGLPGEKAEMSDVLKKAAEMNVGDLQAEIEAWHGSGSVFTKFDHSHMGEGAGSQVFGWGTYLSSSKNVAEGYSHKDDVIKKYKGVIVNPDPYSDNAADRAYFYVQQEHGVDNAIKFLKSLIKEEEDESIINDYKESINTLQDKESWSDLDKVLYKVDIPEETGDNYLDWMITIKKPLRRKIAEAVRQLDGEPKQSFIYTNYKNGWESLADMIEREQWAYKEIHDRLLMAFGGKIKDAEKVSKLMNSIGFVGVKYPAGTIMGGGEGATNYVIFNEDDAKITETIQFMFGDEDSQEQPAFYSNAEYAVTGIKQEKATPDQWRAMIEKAGGLKAGEDKWIGLSDWLKEQQESDKKSLTKQEVLDYLRQNKIQIEETPYQEYFNVDDLSKMQEFRKEFDELVDKYNKERKEVDDEANSFNDEMFEKYGQGWANDPERMSEEDQKRNDDMIKRWSHYFKDEVADLAFQDMVEKYGEDFGMAFEVAYESGQLVPQMDMYGDELSDAAKHFLEFEVQPINSTRLSYTTDKLENKKEIALTVPTIEPYNESDQIHFGDAGGGRAVAWLRFGDTEIHDADTRKALDEASERLYDFLDRMSEKYQTNPDEPEKIEDKLTAEEKAEHAAIMADIRKYDEADEASTKKVAVIDEIQSKRHQDGREHGYKQDVDLEELKRAQEESREFANSLYDKYVKGRPERVGSDFLEFATQEEKDKFYELSSRVGKLMAKKVNGVPRAPFEKNWHELAMKRMLRYAAENGYDKIAWTTGEQQADRYNLSNVVNHIDVGRWGEDVNQNVLEVSDTYKGPSSWEPSNEVEKSIKEYIEYCMEKGDSFLQSYGYALNQITDAPEESKGWTTEAVNKVADAIEADLKGTKDMRGVVIDLKGEDDMIGLVVNRDGRIVDSSMSDFEGKQLSDVVGKEVALKILGEEDNGRIGGNGLRIGGEGMKGFYDEILPRFMNKYGKKWGVKVEDIYLPEIGQTMHVVDVTPEMKESVMQGQPMFQKEGKSLLGWSDGKQVYLTQDGLNPNTPVHECTHLWDKWCQQEEPELWKRLVAAMKTTPTWEEISKNPNYRNIWNDENRMASEVHSRLCGAVSEEEFTKAAFKKNTTQAIINEVKSVLRKFWETILRLFGKHTKTIGDDWNSFDAIVRMPLRDLLNQDFEKVMKTSGGRADAMMGYHGSSAIFDKFDLSKVGSGEGQAVSGYGTYVTTSEGTARYYANVSADKKRKVVQEGGYTINGKVVRDPALVRAHEYLKKADGNIDEAIKACEHSIEVLNRHKDNNPFAALRNNGKSVAEEAMDYLKKEQEAPGTIGFQEEIIDKPGRQLYEVEIPDDTGSNYFDLDKKLTQKQKTEIKKRFLDALDMSEDADYWKKNRDIIDYDWKQVDSKDATGDAARGVMEQFLDAKTVSKLLSDMGYVGSKAKGSDGTTYIIYDEGNIAIKNRVEFMIDNLDFHIEDNPQTVERLDREPKKVGYRNVVLNEDGTLGSPMASRLGKKGVGREATTPFEFGKWERSDEHPELATENGKIDLIKPDNKEVGSVDYNPYIHIRPTKVNKQFKQAWERPNLVYVETEYPESELTSGYQADKAKKAVGMHDWNGGELMLSRWDKPIRIVPWEEVADDWEKEFAGRGVEFDIVPPALLPILAERGVEILPPHKGMGKACEDAYKAWKSRHNDLMHRRSMSAVEVANERFNKRLMELDKDRKQKNRVLKLGNPGTFLLAGGVHKGEIVMDFDRFVRKSSENYEHDHPFSAEDIKDLPKNINAPIAVFDSTHGNDKVILTELQKNGRNFVVVIRATEQRRKGGIVLEVNEIQTLFPKDAKGIVKWFIDGLFTNVDKEKALNWIKALPTHPGTSIDSKELNSAANIVKEFENPSLSEENLRKIYANVINAGENAAEQLGGVNVIWEQQALEPGTKGWYDPNDNTVHVALDEVEDADEAVRTVYHEKLGHEGLVALLGSQEAVDKFGQFVYDSASKDLRKRIVAKAAENDAYWQDSKRMSKAAQEVLGDIAANGPRTADEFDLWTKVKHYLIRLLNKLNAKWKGLLNDKDLAYYILKTGEALKKWNQLDDAAKENLAQQAGQYDIMRSRGGKPRKRNNESQAQYFQRLREWEKWRVARQQARDNNDPEPTEEQFHEQAEAQYKADLQEWKDRNGIADGEDVIGSFPRRQDGESPQEYAVRVADYEAQNDLLKTAPQLIDYLRKASDDYRAAYTAWRERYDLQEEMSVDQRIYEGDVDPMPTYTDAEVEAQALAERELADAEGFEIDEVGAKRMAKLAVIERRKDFESANAEDAIWVYDFTKMSDAVAKELAERVPGATGKELRAALPFLIEANRRKENLEAERENAVMEINKSQAIQQARTFVDFYNLDLIQDELKALEEAWKDKERMQSGLTEAAYRDAAASLAKKLNELNAGRPGYNDLYADDIMQIRSLLTSASTTGRGEIMPEFAQKYEGLPEVQELMKHVKEWYDEFYQVLEDAGLRGDAGYIEDGYVNHVWDKQKSDPKAWEQYIENRQRIKSPNMRHREIDTYMDGISIGLVPKYTDIADMIAHYSRQNNEAVANSHFLDDLKFVVVQEMNADGEVTAILPLLMTDKPEALLRDKYAQYYVPGVGDVYVLKHVQKRFANIFGTMRTPDAAEWLSNLGKGYDIVSSTAKKIQLALSGFHALALFEVDVAQNGPVDALKHLFKYIIVDSYKSGTVPAYAHPEDFQLAAKHLVQLGATEDYAAADVNAITKKLRNYFKDMQMDDAAWKKAAGVAGSPAAIFMDWINQGFDTVLWNYLHDGLKLCAFKELAKQVERRVIDKDLSDETREQLLDEAGQYVNDMFGGQYFELLNISPATLKWMRRALLSPDWLISTQRHFFANFGFGSIYSDGGFREYIKYNWDNIQRAFGKDVPRNEVRRLRSYNAKLCYLVGVIFFFQTFYNAINALMRWMDEKDEKAKAEEERKKNPTYKSPYELAYPDGMKWYDYTMWGNAVGQQTHLFTGRYSDGTETYVRWGKQFREFPELFIGRYGIEFPSPLIQRMMSKGNPNIGTIIDFLGAQNIGGFDGSYENKELREKYGKTVATLAAMSRHFIPFGMPTQTDKEYKWLDFFMPSSKGFSRWKAKDYFETFIMDGDWAGIEATYNACVMNGVDAEATLDAAIKSIKATQKKELADDATDLSSAVLEFDAATDPEKRIVLHNRIKKYLKAAQYKVMTREEAVEKVRDFIDGADVAEKENVRYIMLATSDDIIAEERLRDVGRMAKKFKKELNDAKGTDAYSEMKERYGSWLKIDKKVNKAVRTINKNKKKLGALHEDEIMNSIRETISKTQAEIDEIQAPQ